jgi:hypothetical protein
MRTSNSLINTQHEIQRGLPNKHRHCWRSTHETHAQDHRSNTRSADGSALNVLSLWFTHSVHIQTQIEILTNSSPVMSELKQKHRKPHLTSLLLTCRNMLSLRHSSGICHYTLTKLLASTDHTERWARRPHQLQSGITFIVWETSNLGPYIVAAPPSSHKKLLTLLFGPSLTHRRLCGPCKLFQPWNIFH